MPKSQAESANKCTFCRASGHFAAGSFFSPGRIVLTVSADSPLPQVPGGFGGRIFFS